MSARYYDRANAVQGKFRLFWSQVHSCSFLNEMLNRISDASSQVVNLHLYFPCLRDRCLNLDAIHIAGPWCGCVVKASVPSGNVAGNLHFASSPCSDR